MAKTQQDAAPVATGLPGLDYVLGGGYAFNRTHLIEGRTGTGKTTLALQFLVEGRDRGEKCLFITIAEGARELRRIAEVHGLSLDGIDLFELVPSAQVVDPAQDQSIFFTADLELGETIGRVMDRVRDTAPSRVAFGNFSEIRLLADEALRYRRQVMALQTFFAAQNATVLLLETLTHDDDFDLQSLVHCIIRLEQIAIPYGNERRRLRVSKMRGRAFHGGYHDFVIRGGGLVVFPRLVAADSATFAVEDAPASTAIPELDAMLGGGIDRGTTTLICGPSGSGKSALALQVIGAALERDEPALFIAFDETRRNFERRGAALALPVRSALDDGRLTFMRVNSTEQSPGEVTGLVRRHVEQGLRAIVLDSLSGDRRAIGDDSDLLPYLRELLAYLSQRGVLTVMVLADTRVDGQYSSAQYATYLADLVLQVRQVEVRGTIRRLLSVVKKRSVAHERAFRELFIDAQGLRVGPPLDGFAVPSPYDAADSGGDIFLAERTSASKG